MDPWGTPWGIHWVEIARITWARKVVVGNWLRRGVAKEKGEVLGLGGQLAGLLGGCLAGWGLHGCLGRCLTDHLGKGFSGSGKSFW